MRDGAQAIRRALGVLRTLATSRETGLGLSELASRTGLTQPTAHRILKALVAEGVVERKARTRRYALGPEIQLLAMARSIRSPLLAIAEPHIRRLADEIGDTVFLTIRTGHDTICIARRFGSHPIQVHILEVGDRRPLGVSSAGFAILAALPPPEARRILSDNKSRIERFGLTTVEAADMIRRTRKIGFALRERGLVPGTRAVSVAIRDATGTPAAVLTVAGIARRLAPGRIEGLVSRLRRSGAGIEQRLPASRQAV